MTNLRADACSARQRICFCKNGINATGIDASSMRPHGEDTSTNYRLENQSGARVLESEGKQWREWFIAPWNRGGGDAQPKLTRIFRR